MCILQYVISRHILEDTISLHGNNFDVLSRDFAHTPFIFVLVLTVGSPLVLSSDLTLINCGGEKTKLRTQGI